MLGKLRSPPNGCDCDHLSWWLPASSLHCEKSMGVLQPLQTWGLSNSSEKISFSFPQLGHLQVKDERFLFACKPGQCSGVLFIA